MYSASGYDRGIGPPGRCSKWVNEACQARNSSTEPYVVGHNLILSHAAAVKQYRQKYHGLVSLIINATLPLEEALKDPMRINYYYHDLMFPQRTIKEVVNVKGYFACSLLDNFEWNSSYTLGFGINFVGYNMV
ncbi:hypothetical protein Patl1_19640 [Pistacia atlantica]|uniref:Uncharacterized protein n=1 Tax=Pistacia atlantica TaxID=434234 RepID=A0ACC1BY52_9ROSI|nr:hypothetical protein Patl1_19640 [Pistacia atlantica]